MPKEIKSNFNWKNEQAVVTGACGFIGSHLVEQLVEAGTRVKALVLYNSRGSNGWLDDLSEKTKEKITIVSGDIRDTECMQSLIEENDIVFHLAALIGIPYSYQAPRSYVDTNITGTLNILEAGKQNKAKRILVTSTSEVYGTALQVPITEDHPLQAQSPYSATKIAAEKISQSYYLSFGLPVTIVRPFNTFGPRQSARAVIPTIIMQALNGQKEIKLGNPETTRDFNYVNDTATGLMKLAESEEAVGKIVNIGTCSEVSIEDVVKMVKEITGRHLEIQLDSKRIRPEKSDVMRLCADNSLIKSLTSWAPENRLKEGLTKTIEWMKDKKEIYQAERYYI